ncbi:hypothetical protein EXS57_03795 [Candidatus Kaiserbacteria bacterium]|nr:hypothetical protein [Candidatus Kaiserbacteria bacterium]
MLLYIPRQSLQVIEYDYVAVVGLRVHVGEHLGHRGSFGIVSAPRETISEDLLYLIALTTRIFPTAMLLAFQAVSLGLLSL